MSSPTLDSFRDQFAGSTPPVIVFNKSHSGSRLLAETLSAAGVFMGSNLNKSWDSLDMFELVEYLVVNYYPDYSPLWDPRRPPDTKLAALLETVFTRHLGNVDIRTRQRWGWKLCETVYILPVLDYCFAGARFVHLVRDGRDVAFCDHRGPDNLFWRKVYFNTGRIRSFAGIRFTPLSYRRHSHLFNALHWVNSVSTGRAFGAMLRERYVEVRYEELCRNFTASSKQLFEFLDIPYREEALAACNSAVYGSSIGKYKSRSKSRVAQVIRIEKPLLLSLGYLEADTELVSRSPWRSHFVDVVTDIGKRLFAASERGRTWQFMRSPLSGEKPLPVAGKAAPNLQLFLAEIRQTRSRDD